jgi:hypothetical protein
MNENSDCITITEPGIYTCEVEAKLNKTTVPANGVATYRVTYPASDLDTDIVTLTVNDDDVAILTIDGSLRNEFDEIDVKWYYINGNNEEIFFANSPTISTNTESNPFIIEQHNAPFSRVKAVLTIKLNGSEHTQTISNLKS